MDERRTEIHQVGEKRLSNFYDIPLTFNISAILYSNTGTVGKFSRIVYQRGYGDLIEAFFYSGSRQSHIPETLGIQQFMFKINRDAQDGFVDLWKYGLSLFHNHKAVHPLGYDLFDMITQAKYDAQEGLLTRYIDFHPFNGKNLRNHPVE
jgi:hypothetical protein